jgi:hypothetical protein
MLQNSAARGWEEIVGGYDIDPGVFYTFLQQI